MSEILTTSLKVLDSLSTIAKAIIGASTIVGVIAGGVVAIRKRKKPEPAGFVAHVGQLFLPLSKRRGVEAVREV